ncbi:hypothetical protein PR202_ga25331 [Eleusine coracana subsp. coracana]|uniref:Uncharacterized protein n=1 Tax=Eleusine coracana subsp. coracana TaxID=191504 RepID=A0AAV5DBY4_ELECO|nr:hypothetical protein PR202_ga25331 [Eleusine coracana subsp. coracana]
MAHDFFPRSQNDGAFRYSLLDHSRRRPGPSRHQYGVLAYEPAITLRVKTRCVSPLTPRHNLASLENWPDSPSRHGRSLVMPLPPAGSNRVQTGWCSLSELARGARVPTVRPVWGRELLDARSPPRPSFAHREYDQLVVPDATSPLRLDGHEQVRRYCFFFGPGEVAAIRAYLPLHLQTSSTTFEILTAFLWKCRTMALAHNAEEEMRLICIVSAHGGGNNKTGSTRLMRIPRGYYGNAFAFPRAMHESRGLRREAGEEGQGPG